MWRPARFWCASIRAIFARREVQALLGDASKAREKLGWRPTVTFSELVAEMVAVRRCEAGLAGPCQASCRRLRKVNMSTQELSLADRRVWVAGHRGMVGAALMRALAREGAVLLTVAHDELDLRRQSETEAWMRAQSAGIHLYRGRESRRHPGQRHLSGPVSL